MGQFRTLIPKEFQAFMERENFKIETVHGGQLHIIHNPTLTLKIYDCMGHGFGVNVNLCPNFETSNYEGNEISIYWVFKYFELQELSNFNTRTEGAYLKNMKHLYTDLHVIIIQLLRSGSEFWNEPFRRIQLLASEKFNN